VVLLSPNCLINGTIFEKERYGTLNVCLYVLYNFCLKHFSLQEEFSEISEVQTLNHPVLFKPNRNKNPSI